MTEQTQPTDAELIDVWAQFVGDPTPKLPLTDADKVAFARAVLAKWGTPAGAEWKDVVGFEGLYQVSNHGDIRNNKSGLLLAKSLMGAGYVKADLYKDGKRTQTSAHRVVAQAFVDNPDGKPQVNHINGVKDDNRASNLEWCDKTTDHLHRYYELGKVAASIEATNTATGETIFYPSITQAARDGFESSHIYRCLSGDIKQSNGWSFKRPTTDSFTTPQPTQAQAGAVPEEFLRSVIALCTQRGYSPENIEAWSKDDKWVADLWRQADEMLTIKGADHGKS